MANYCKTCKLNCPCSRIKNKVNNGFVSGYIPNNCPLKDNHEAIIDNIPNVDTFDNFVNNLLNNINALKKFDQYTVPTDELQGFFGRNKEFIKPFSGRPERSEVISEEDICNLIIALSTSDSLDNFLEIV